MGEAFPVAEFEGLREEEAESDMGLEDASSDMDASSDIDFLEDPGEEDGEESGERGLLAARGKMKSQINHWKKQKKKHEMVEMWRKAVEKDKDLGKLKVQLDRI